jgi:hypothetical protein
MDHGLSSLDVIAIPSSPGLARVYDLFSIPRIA